MQGDFIYIYFETSIIWRNAYICIRFEVRNLADTGKLHIGEGQLWNANTLPQWKTQMFHSKYCTTMDKDLPFSGAQLEALLCSEPSSSGSLPWLDMVLGPGEFGGSVLSWATRGWVARERRGALSNSRRASKSAGFSSCPLLDLQNPDAAATLFKHSIPLSHSDKLCSMKSWAQASPRTVD